MNKKYLPSALILYLNYFIHGVGCSILGQAVIKEALAASWGVEAMAITAISAALGLGRLIALPFAGPLSDKLGRRISTAIGSGSYAIYLIGLALAFNAGTNGGYQIAYVCAIVGGIANSFLDTGIYLLTQQKKKLKQETETKDEHYWEPYRPYQQLTEKPVHTSDNSDKDTASETSSITDPENTESDPASSTK